MRYHVNIMQCMQPNFLLTGQVYPMLMSSVPHAWGSGVATGFSQGAKRSCEGPLATVGGTTSQQSEKSLEMMVHPDVDVDTS